MKNDKDLNFVINSPLITGKINSLNCDSPLLVSSALFKKKHLSNSNDLSFQEKSVVIGKYGFLKQVHINEININNNNFLNMSSSLSFQTESLHDSANSLDQIKSPTKFVSDYPKSPSKFSISKKNNNKTIKLNFPSEEEEKNHQFNHENEQKLELLVVRNEEENEKKTEFPNNIHKRNFSFTKPGDSFFKRVDLEKKGANFQRNQIISKEIQDPNDQIISNETHEI